MRKEIWRILKDLENGKVTTNEAYHLLCDLFAVSGQSELLVCKCGLPKDKKGGSFNCMRTDCDMPIAN